MLTPITLNNGVTIPQLGFGTWKLKGVTGEAERAVSEALRVGYRHIDTARIYMNEKSVGRAIAKSGLARDEVFVTTKLWNGDQSHAQQAMDKSLQRLGLEQVDLYLMHYPVSKTRLQAWQAMEAMYAAGQARAIGVSNFTIQHLQELMQHAKIVPAVNQVEFHPFLFQKELLDFCRQHGIVLEAYSPLAHGQQMDHAVLSEIAAAHHKSNAQIMVRWSLQHGNVVIPKSSHPGRIRQNYEVFDFNLSADELARINDLNQDLRTCWDPTSEI